MDYEKANKFIYSAYTATTPATNINTVLTQFNDEEQRYIYQYITPYMLLHRYGDMIRNSRDIDIINSLWNNKNIYLYYDTNILTQIISNIVNHIIDTIVPVISESKCFELLTSMINRYYDLLCNCEYTSYDILFTHINYKTAKYFDVFVDLFNKRQDVQQLYINKADNYLEMILTMINRCNFEAYMGDVNKIINYILPYCNRQQAKQLFFKCILSRLASKCRIYIDVPYQYIDFEDTIINKIAYPCSFRYFLDFYNKHWDVKTAKKYIRKCGNKNFIDYEDASKNNLMNSYKKILEEVTFANDEVKNFVLSQYMFQTLQ